MASSNQSQQTTNYLLYTRQKLLYKKALTACVLVALMTWMSEEILPTNFAFDLANHVDTDATCYVVFVLLSGCWMLH